MVKRRRGFVEKFLCTCVGYIYMKVSPQKFCCYCAHIQEILIVFIGRKHVVDPVERRLQGWNNCSIYILIQYNLKLVYSNIVKKPALVDIFQMTIFMLFNLQNDRKPRKRGPRIPLLRGSTPFILILNLSKHGCLWVIWFVVCSTSCCKSNFYALDLITILFTYFWIFSGFKLIEWYMIWWFSFPEIIHFSDFLCSSESFENFLI